MSRVAMLFLLILSSVLGPTQFSESLVAQENSGQINLQFIIDQSGSMGAETDTGVLRMVAAQTVFSEVIKQIPDTGEINVGLRVYGHLGNNQADGQALSCQSTELLVPMNGVNHELLESTVENLYPVGWTPIGLALQQAGGDFPVPGPDDENIIILITDGLETCGLDPAVEAGALKDSEKQITTHVIGFGTNAEELSILESITAASEGELIGSQNAAQLIGAIFEILEDSNVVAESGDGLSRESPLGIGRAGEIGDYKLSVISVTSDATSVVMNENQFNELATEENQFFMARISATYVGTETGLPFVDLDLKAVGANNTSYSHYQNSCGVIPEDSLMISEIFPGGTVEFNICWEIRSTDADTLVMYVEPMFAGNESPLWFALGNPILQSTTATPVPEPERTDSSVTEAQRGESDASPNDSFGSTEDTPVPVGRNTSAGDYEVTVISVTPYATDIVMAENPYNEPPGTDEQFFIARVSVTYTGNETGVPWLDLEMNAVGDRRASYSPYQNSCGVYPDDPMMISELFPGGTAEYNVCWSIKTDDAGSLIMYVTELFGSSDRIWFSLTP